MTFVLSDPERLVAAGLGFVSVYPFDPAGNALDEENDYAIGDARETPSFMVAARQLADRNPEAPSAIARLAQAAQAVGDVEGARQAAHRTFGLIQGTPDKAAAIAALQVLLSDDEVAFDESLLERIPGDPGVKAVIAARLAIKRGAHVRALEIVEREGSASIDLLSLRGWLLLKTQRFTDAIAAFRHALDFGVRSDLLTNLGYAYAATGARQKAIRATLQARALDPGNRTIGMNLVSFYRNGGELDAGISELRRLRSAAPDDVGLHIAEADLRLAASDVDGAERVLRRARTSQLWAVATLLQRAELETNLAFLQFRQNRIDRMALLQLVREQLGRVEYESLDIASMLPALCRTTADRDILADLLAELERKHPSQDLEALRLQLDFLECDFESATDRAVAWSEAEIFTPEAAAAAVHLLSDVRNDFQRASTIGLKALSRIPASLVLINNTAYALALDGQYARARQVVNMARGETVHLTATEALLDLLTGRINEGIGGYRRAYESAVKMGDPRLALLVWWNGIVALRRTGVSRSEIDWTVELPEDWAMDPLLVLMKRVADVVGEPLPS